MRLKEDFHHTIVIERSEFICYVRKCLDEAQAKAFIQEIRRLHPEGACGLPDVHGGNES